MNPEVPMWPIATAVVFADGTATLEIHGETQQVTVPESRDIRDALIDMVARDLALPLGEDRYVRLNTTDPDGSVGVIGVNHAGDVVAISRTPPPPVPRRRRFLRRGVTIPAVDAHHNTDIEDATPEVDVEAPRPDRAPPSRPRLAWLTGHPGRSAAAALVVVIVAALSVVGFRAATSTGSPEPAQVAGAIPTDLGQLQQAVIAESQAIAKREAAIARQKALAAQRAKARRVAAQRKAAQRRAAQRRKAEAARAAAARRATPSPAPRTTPQPSYTPPRSSPSPPRRSNPAPRPAPRPKPSPAQEFGP